MAEEIQLIDGISDALLFYKFGSESIYMRACGLSENYNKFYGMLKKYSVLLGMIISIFLLLIAMMVYPGGTLADKNSVGFHLTENYISNLFGAKQ